MHLRVSQVARLLTSLASRFDQRQFISRAARFPDLALSQLLARVDLQLLKVALRRLTEIGNQVVAIRNLNGGGSALSSSIGIQAGPIAGDQAKVDAHVAKSIAAKPKLVRISTAYGQQKEGSALPRNKYTEIRTEKPATKEEAARPEFKTCKYTTEAIVSEGVDKGELRKVCTEPTCPVHHSKPRAQKVADDGKWKAEQEKQRREAAIANTTGIRILAAISAALPVRLMKRDLLFVVERLASMVDENPLTVLAKQHGIKQAKDSDSIGKLFAAYLRRVEESVLGRVLVELTILHATARQNAAQVLRDAAAVYKVDTDAIALKVKQEFAAKEAHIAKKPVAKPAKKVKAA
jgi:ParB family chromosome partitioning protein